MKETQVNIMIPTELWDKVTKLVAQRTLKGETGNSKKAVVADALKVYLEGEEKE